MKLKDVTTFLDKKNTSGATLDELKNELGDEDMDTLKRLLQAGMDWGDIKKDGKGRGLRYYDSKYEIVKILPVVTRQKHINHVEDIDISHCLTVKDRIKTVLASSFKLTQLHKFSYREKLNEPESNRSLYDFMHQGAIDIDVNVAHNLEKHKNVIISKNTKLINNKLTITRIDEHTWAIIKYFYECPDRPEVITFNKYEDIEKCFRTLFAR